MKRIGIIIFLIVECVLIQAQVKPDTATRPASISAGNINPVPATYGSNMLVNYVRTWNATKPYNADTSVISASRTIQEVKQVTRYYDGLGRLLQTVEKQLSPSGKDLVNPVIYDVFGRETYKYLPFVQIDSNTNTGKFKRDVFNNQKSFYNNTTYNPGFLGEQVYYSKNAFEASPLDRIDTAFSSGNNWGGSNAGTIKSAQLNIASDSVRIWNIGFTIGVTPTSTAYYSAGTLLKNVTTIENGKKSIEFQDKDGLIILKKVQVDASPSLHHTGWLCTYFVYDDLNNLRFVIQPLGTDALKGRGWQFEGSTMNSSTIARELCFNYEYDEKNRLIIKRVPGAGEQWMVYDARDRVVMTQDSVLRLKGKWLYTQYDALSRQSVTGLWTNANNRVYHQGQAGGSTAYPNPPSNFEVLTQIYYDDYAWVSGSGSGLSSTFINTYSNNTNYFYTPDNTTFPYPQIITPHYIATGLATGTKIKILGTANYMYSVSFYDDRGRIIQTHSTNFSGSKDTVTNQYDYYGKLLRSLLCHSKNSPNTQRYLVLTKNDYDANGRVVRVSKKTGNSPEVVLADNAYDELGHLQKKKLGRKRDAASQNTYTSASIDSLQYTYNIRGWIRGINKDYARAVGGVNNYFGVEVNYDFGFSQTQLNGNIAGIRWRSKGDEEQRAYGFTYDAANRFTKSDFTQYSTTWNTTAGIDFTVKDMSYDANGNILSMTQKGVKLTSSPVIDSLAYGYTTNTNRLHYVTDRTNDNTSKLGDFKESVNNTSQDYGYNGNGAITLDNNRTIDRVTYNHLNLPDTMHVLGKGNIFYTYDAAGKKIKKQVVDSTVNPVKTTTTIYLEGFVYDNDTLQYLSHEEGRVRPKRANYSDTMYYDYFVKDHLTNVRMILTDELQKDQYPAVTFEDASVANEQLYYEKVDEQRTARPGSFYTSGTNGTKVQVLRKSVQSIGAGKLLRVMATDSIHVKVDYYMLNDATDNANANGLNSVITVLLSLLNSASAPLPIHGNATALTNALNSSTPFTDFLAPQSGSGGTSMPKAYLNILFFDEQFRFVQQNSEIVQVSTKGSGQTILRVNGTAKVAPKNGYVYVYVSNESNNFVYFDNLQISHTRGAILEETHYYPFGLAMAGISSKSLKFLYAPNKKGYNSNELQHKEFSDGSGLEAYDFNARTYDQQTGRFLQIDPESEEADQESWSPYNFGYNNPILNGDPDGKIPIPLIIIGLKFLIGAAVEYGSQVYDNYKEGKKGVQMWKPRSENNGVAGGVGKIILNGATSTVDPSGGIAKKVAISTITNIGESLGGQLLDGNGIDGTQTLLDVTVMTVASNVKIDASKNVSMMKNEAKDLERKARNNPKSTRSTKATDARNQANRADRINAGAAVATSETSEVVLSKASSRLIKKMDTMLMPVDANPNKIDNTGLNRPINITLPGARN